MRTTKSYSSTLPILTVTLAAAIFIADTVTKLEIAAAVLYVAVVLMTARFCTRRGVVLIAAGCMVLTIISYILSSTGAKQAGLINTGISLLAIGLTAYLALQIESAKSAANTLAESEQLRNALLGSVSHDLRTPLVSILGGASILAERASVMNNSRAAVLAKDIRDEAMRLNSDIQNLLDAARINSQGLLTRRDWTDATDVLNAGIERVRLRYPDRRFDLSHGDTIPLLYVDPVLVEQALSQIFSNAVKFSPHDSTIHIVADVVNHQFVISVRDEGVGLTADEIEKLTERFFRGRRHVGKIPGSGLGLWIAETFIKSNGGEFLAESTGEGQGTTIKIAFPIPDDSDNKLHNYSG